MAGAEEKQENWHENLKAGDILVWSTQIGDAFEEAVALLSGDEMTHAALVSRKDTTTVIEQVPGGTTTNSYPWTREGRTVYAMRREVQNLGPVLDIAEASLEANDPLSWKNLITLAILLLMRNPHLLYTGKQVVKDGFIDFFQGAAQDPSVETPNSAYCSEFVYDCYEKAGPEYKLDLKRVLDDQYDNVLDKLFQKIVKHIRADSGSNEPQTKKLKTSPPKRKDPEEHHQSLLEAVKVAKQEHEEKGKLLKASSESNEHNEEIDKELAAAIVGFACASLKDSDQPPIGTPPVDLALHALNNLKNAANLVTPGDLTRIKNNDAIKVGTFMN